MRRLTVINCVIMCVVLSSCLPGVKGVKYITVPNDDCAPTRNATVNSNEMKLIPAGLFVMGDTLGDATSKELPVHAIYVSSFYIDKYEVTNEKMRQVLQWAYDNRKIVANKCGVTYTSPSTSNAVLLVDLAAKHCQIKFSAGIFSVDLGKENYPCVEVSWFGAAAYCNFKNEIEGLTACYTTTGWFWGRNPSANGYRLPTEAEWEKAARGRALDSRFPWNNNDTISHDRANYFSTNLYAYDVSSTRGFHPRSSNHTMAVGSFSPNGYGLYDMAGNVWEWCSDCYDEYYYSHSAVTNPPGGVEILVAVVRGGSFFDMAPRNRCAYRIRDIMTSSNSSTGFRCVIGFD